MRDRSCRYGAPLEKALVNRVMGNRYCMLERDRITSHVQHSPVTSVSLGWWMVTVAAGNAGQTQQSSNKTDKNGGHDRDRRNFCTERTYKNRQKEDTPGLQVNACAASRISSCLYPFMECPKRSMFAMFALCRPGAGSSPTNTTQNEVKHDFWQPEQHTTPPTPSFLTLFDQGHCALGRYNCTGTPYIL